jgi:hypothetical protein
MSAIVGINARVDISTDSGSTWDPLPERNEFSISISVDVAEHKVFVATLADAWVGKARTWMNWSGSLSGYFDDADDTIFDTMKAGDVVMVRFYTDRASTDIWEGSILLTSVEHTVNTDDYATLSVDFEGIGALSRGVAT